MRDILPQIYSESSLQYQTLSRVFDALVESFAYILCYPTHGHTLLLAYNDRNRLVDSLTREDRREWLQFFFDEENTDYLVNYSMSKELHQTTRSIVSFIANAAKVSYTEIKEKVKEQMKTEKSKVPDLNEVYTKILLRNILIIFVLVGPLLRNFKQITHRLITAHPQNHVFDQIHVHKSNKKFQIQLDYYNQPKAPSEFSLSVHNGKASFNPFMWREVLAKPIVSETYFLNKVKSMPATVEFANILENARPRRTLFGVEKINDFLKTSLTEMFVDRTKRNDMEATSLHFVYLHQLVVDFQEHYAFLKYYEDLITESLKEELPQYLASKSLPTGNLSHQSQASTVGKVESTGTGLAVKNKTILDELKNDFKKGKNPVKSATNMLTKAGQLCSADFLTTEEWHNFIREVASHEAMTRDDVEYLRASKDIYEGELYILKVF